MPKGDTLDRVLKGGKLPQLSKGDTLYDGRVGEPESSGG